jgi:tRNA modification GTPase
MVATANPLPDLDDTIVALATAPGPALRAIVRLSGRRAAAIASLLCPDFARRQAAGRRFVPAAIVLPGLPSPLPTDAYLFAAPHSYTGQDVVELHTLSCPPLLEAVVAECLTAGARAAQPGEFTMRAFLAGKLDLTRAEAVLGVIEAGSRDELTQALAQLAGGVAHPLQELRQDVLDLLADVEAGLDFGDEDISFVAADELLRRLARGLALLTLLRRQLDQRALSRRPFRVVLAGRPNAGKSSLFNALASAPTALVSPEPGTTRDYLECDLDLGGVPVRLIDTAGLRPAADDIETAAQGLGRREVESADLVLLCLGRGAPTDLAELGLSDIPALKLLTIATKCDEARPAGVLLATSVVTGEGLDLLRQALAEQARRRGGPPLAPSLSRCRHHVEASVEHLRQAHAVVVNEEPAELLALELRLTLEELGAMVGAVYTDDLLDRIFSRFCIGK